MTEMSAHQMVWFLFRLKTVGSRTRTTEQMTMTGITTESPKTTEQIMVYYIENAKFPLALDIKNYKRENVFIFMVLFATIPH